MGIGSLLPGFVRRQLTVSLMLMGLYSIGLTIVDTPSGMLLGIRSGAANVVPFMG